MANKLYLRSLEFKLFEHLGNLIVTIFNQDRLFASWVNSDVRLVVSKKDLGISANSYIEFEREILILSFSNGVLIESKKEVERYISKWATILKRHKDEFN